MSELSTAQKRQRSEDSQSSIDPSDTAAVMDTSTESSNVAVDPEGDVILVLDGAELQVSSKALSLASSVFKAMLGPHFLEGQDLSATSPKRISLPEDDAVAMTVLCIIVHHQSNKVTYSPHYSILVEIGALCDKYDCSEALKPWTRTWWGYYQHDLRSDTTTMNQLLFPFYAFDDAESFKWISKMTVYWTKGFLNKPKTTFSLPDGVLELLQQKKWEVEHQLCQDLETMIEPLLGKDYRSGRKPAWDIPRCDGDGRTIWEHHKELRNMGLWPLASALRTMSIMTVCGRLKGYKEAPKKDCDCSGCSINFEQAVKKASLDALTSFDGLCLNCVKLEGSGTGASRKCQLHKPVHLEELSPTSPPSSLP